MLIPRAIDHHLSLSLALLRGHVIRQSFRQLLTTVAVTLVAAVGHRVRLYAEELQFGVERGDALVARVVKSTCLVVDENRSKHLRVAVEHVLGAPRVVEVLLLVGAE